MSKGKGEMEVNLRNTFLICIYPIATINEIRVNAIT